MSMPWPSPVKNYHTDTYPAIDPSLPQLSTKGKNIVITGGGSGIGPVIAHSFAKSRASSISILGRTEKTLLETKAAIERDYPGTRIFTYTADIVDKGALTTAFEAVKSAVGPVDILIANAGYLPTVVPIAQSELEEWYNGFEVNVKGNFNLVTTFLSVAAKDASIINISTGMTHLAYLPGYSGYHTSKLAAAKFFDYLHHEYPEFFVLNVHPGVIRTGMEAKATASGNVLPFDEIQLPADFVVWAVSQEARFLNGKLIWAHWDVDELKTRAKEIEGGDKFTLGLLGWP